MAQWQPHVETTSRPWFGPRRRAKRVLGDHRSEVIRPRAALGGFRKVLGDEIEKISHIRFIDYVNAKDGFRYTIAVCWTLSDAKFRQAIYDRGPDVAEMTGWYLLPQGERLRSVEAADRSPAGMSLDQLPELRGHLRSIESAVRPDYGCSIRIETSSGDSLLLDTGLPERLDLLSSDRVVLLSHAHADHSGGLTTGRTGSLPTVMSTGTARVLRAGGWLSDSVLRRSCAVVGAGEAIRLGSVEAEPLMVPHFPGAVGWIVRDVSQSLVFTGDICLRTARHDFTADLAAVASSESPRIATVLLDATMAGREAGASASEASARLLERGDDDVVLVARSADHLLYAFLDLFHTVQQSDRRHSVSFLLTPRLRLFFEILHAAFITRDFDDMDPMLVAQYGRSMSSWGESRWLLWLDSMQRAPEGRRLWFVITDELDDPRLPEVAAIGTVGRDDLADGVLADRPDYVPLEVDTTPWTAHSDAASVADASRALAAAGHDVVLFHNFSKRTKKFIRDQGLDAKALSGRLEIGSSTDGGT